MSRFSVTPVVLQPAPEPELPPEPVPVSAPIELQQPPFIPEPVPADQQQVCVQASNEVLQQQMEQLYQQRLLEQQEQERQQREYQLQLQQQQQPHIDLALFQQMQQLQQQAAAAAQLGAPEAQNAAEYELQQQFYQQQQQQQFQQALALHQQQLQHEQSSSQHPQPSMSTQASVDHSARAADSLSSRMPETLEQLKIGLENITHVHVVTSKTSTASLSSTTSSHSVQQPNSDQPQDFPPEAGVMVAPEEYVLDGNAPAHLLQQQQQQQHLLPSSQEVSSYNSRRTSADMNQPVVATVPAPVQVEQQVQVQQVSQQTPQPGASVPNSVAAVSAAGSDASTPNLRDQEKRLSNQGSVDRIDSSGNNSLADLHQKLAQLTSAQLNEQLQQQQQQQLQQPQQQQQQQQSTTPKPPQLIAFEQQQQLQTQQNSAVTSPSVEHPEPKFPNDAKPMIRKVSRFQVQTVQESPKAAAPQEQQLPQQQPQQLVVNHDTQQQQPQNYSSPTDEKSCQTFPAPAPQVASELPRTPNIENVQPNFAAALQQQQHQQMQAAQLQQQYQQQMMTAAAQQQQQQQVQPIMQTVPIQQQVAPPPQQQQQMMPVMQAAPQQQQQYQQQQLAVVQPQQQMVYAEQNALEQFNSEDIGQNLVAIQNHLRGMQLMPSSRQQLQLLLQRQHIEHEELKLRHFLELEKFLKQQKEDMKPAVQPAPAPLPQQVPVSMQQQVAPIAGIVPAGLADITSPTLTVSRGFDQGTITTPSYYNNGAVVSAELVDPVPQPPPSQDPTLTIVNETNH